MPLLEAIAIPFAAGLASAASPCLLPLYPGFLAYLAANSRSLSGRSAAGLLGLVILAGVLSTMVVVGVVLALVAVPLGSLLAVAVPAIDGLLIVLGLLLLASRNPFARLPGAKVPVVANPYGQAYLYGAMLGPLALPCAGPFLIVLLATAAGAGEAVGKIGTFAVYGLGFGLPLVALSLLAGARSQVAVRWIVVRHRAIELIAGALLVAVGVWDLAQNWGEIVASFGG